MPSPVLQSRVNSSVYERFVEKIEANGLDQRVVIEAIMVGFVQANQKEFRELLKARQRFVQAQAESEAGALVDAAKRSRRGGRPKR